VAVVAERYWQARAALDALRIRFAEGPDAALDTGRLRDPYRRAMDGKSWLTVRREGDATALSDGSLPEATAEYESQFLAHATMEPMNCTAHVGREGCEVWAPTQGQELAQLALSQALGLPREKVRAHRTLSGGGFGRRVLPDFAV
jgi:CO/xanthine dehydrogenase Mo-binding subunit